MNQFSPIQRTGHLPDMIASEIMSQISSGTLQPGDILPTETNLASTFGVSRNVVREAIARLRSDGLIETKQGRGGIVKPPSEHATFRLDPSSLAEQKSVKELFEIRLMLEPEAAARAAENCGMDDLKQIQEAAASLPDRDFSGCEFVNAESDFHRLVAVASGNPLLGSIVGYLASRICTTTHCIHEVIYDDHRLSKIKEMHTRIANAIQARDPNEARDLMKAHLVDSMALFSSAPRSNPVVALT